MSGIATEVRRRTWGVDVIAMTALLGVVIAGFSHSFDSAGYLAPAIGGAVLGIVIGVFGAVRSWNALAVAVAVIVAYLLFGGALALAQTTLYGIPTLGTLGRLVGAVVTSWKSFVTAGAPVSMLDGHGVVPLLTLLVAGATAVSFALRLRAPAWALVPVIGALLLQAALGVATTALPLVQGVAFAVITVGWLGVRHALDPSRLQLQVHGDTTGAVIAGAATRRVVGGVVVLAIAAAAGIGVASAVAPSGPRAVLRDVVTPPLERTDDTSPLQSFRHFVRDRSTFPQFTVTGLPKGQRLRLATLDAYDGSVLGVGGATGAGSARFAPLRSDRVDPGADTVSIRVSVNEYDDVWVPTVGDVRNVRFTGDDADQLRRSSYASTETGTVLTTHGLRTGDGYVMQSVITPQPAMERLAQAEFADVELPELSGVPDALTEIATRATAEAKTPLAKVRALQDFLLTEGYFSHGLADDPPSLSGHGAVRIQDFLDRSPIVGDDEQYAVAMVLLADRLGIPARAVMGWYPESDRESRGDFQASGADLHVWVEVAFQDFGWVSFDVTPPEDKVPTEQAIQPKANPRPQVLQPPPPIQEPAEDPPLMPDDRDPRDGDDGDDQRALDVPVVLFVSIGGGLILLALPFLLIIAAKAWRRRRRLRAERTHDRIAGGWDEVVDRARDMRVDAVVGATRDETARQVALAFPEAGVRDLAAAADARVFGPGSPSVEDAQQFWSEADGVIHRMTSALSRRDRMRAKISLRSLTSRWGKRAIAPVRTDGGEGERR